MGQLLATDLNNPEFVGAIANPDSLHYVEFYMHEPLDKWGTEEASAKAERLVRVFLPKQPYVRIMMPGMPNSIIETPVRESHKQRFPQQWLQFQMNEGLVDQQEMPGWKIEEWPYLADKQDMIREFKNKRYSTVEQIAGATDIQCQNMGLGGVGWRKQAKEDLIRRFSADLHATVEAKNKEVDEMKLQMADMLKQMQELTANQPIIGEKRGPGRPPKEAHG